ncbi:hypothetical protein CK203_012464 [Vitis vinifera]|uniref:Reverse transcriptase domain-containing protein n=1 Tax=Vitis vinifera TaxID=29760 RepID=A0A438JKX3_VITVI|nr:hypothetical protein CK203_012464 [Vitis vinifera]
MKSRKGWSEPFGLYCPIRGIDILLYFGLQFETLKSLDALGLEELFSKEEVFGALLGCNGDKATGHDAMMVVSGLRINLEKSKLIPMGRVENFDDLAMEFGCRVGSLPCTYLGLPLGAPFKSIDSLEWSEGAVL